MISQTLIDNANWILNNYNFNTGKEIVRTKKITYKPKINNCELCSCDKFVLGGPMNMFVICDNCGLCYDRQYNNFDFVCDYNNPQNYGEDRERPNQLLPKYSTGTQMKYSRKYKNLQRIHKWNIIDNKEKQLITDYNNINKMIVKIEKNLNINIDKHSINRAKYLFKNKIEGHNNRANIRKNIMIKSIVESLVENGFHIIEEQIVLLFNDNKQTYNKVSLKYNKLENKNEDIEFDKQNTTLNELIKHFTINELETKVVKELIRRINTTSLLDSVNVNTLTCAAVYLLLNRDTKNKKFNKELLKNIGGAIGTHSNPIEKSLKKLNKHIDLLKIGLL